MPHFSVISEVFLIPESEKEALEHMLRNLYAETKITQAVFIKMMLAFINNY